MGAPTGKPHLGEECWSPSVSQGEARVRPAGCLGAQEGWGPSFSVIVMLCTLRGGLVTWATPIPGERVSQGEYVCTGGLGNPGIRIRGPER